MSDQIPENVTALGVSKQKEDNIYEVIHSRILLVDQAIN